MFFIYTAVSERNKNQKEIERDRERKEKERKKGRGRGDAREWEIIIASEIAEEQDIYGTEATIYTKAQKGNAELLNVRNKTDREREIEEEKEIEIYIQIYIHIYLYRV